MADSEIKCPSLPRKYITIVDLQKRWMEQQKKQQLEKGLNQNLSIKNDVSVGIRRNSNHQECNRSESNLNFKHRRPFYKKFKGKKQFQVVNKQCEINFGTEDDRKVEYENRKVEKRENKQVKEEIVLDDQITVEKIDIQEKGDYQMAEKLDDQVKGDDQTVEIERKLKEVSLTTTKLKNERSTAEMKRSGTVYRGHRRANHRGFGMPNRDELENQGEGKGDWKSMAAIQGSRKVYGGYGRVENRGMHKNWEIKREKTGEVVNKDREKQVFVKGSRSMDAWQGQRRRKEYCRRLVWVKKSEIKENHNY